MIAIASLRACPIFEDFTDQELDMLLGAAWLARFEVGSTLSEEGRPANVCYVIISGEVEVVRAGPGGETVLDRHGVGTMLGHMALISRKRRTTTLRAVTPVVVIEFSRDVFDRLLVAASPFARHFQERLAVVGSRQLRELTARAIEIARDAREKGDLDARSQDALRRLWAATGEWSTHVPHTTRPR